MIFDDSKKQPNPAKWLRYSGASMCVTVNPCHWSWIPRFRRERDIWSGPVEWNGSASWLMLTVRVWIDDGSW
jgi:hypothetical protein